VALDWSAELDGNFDPDFEEGSTDARLTVRFLNHSKNGDEFHWVFLDTLGGIRETGITYDTTEMPEFTYINADKFYFPSLLSISEKGCEDSITIAPGIQVVGSQLEIPNYFSPTSSREENRIWRFKHQSLKTCKISVFDRSGRVVYKQDIPDIYEWEGWDGTIRDSKREAPPGGYYYIIEATGYDGVEYYQPSIWSQMKIFGGDGRVDNGQGSAPGNGEDTPGAGVSLTSYTGWVYLFRN
jgi:gliding motility-associated-like protein